MKNRYGAVILGEVTQMPGLPEDFRRNLFRTIDEMKDELIGVSAKILTFETVSGGKTDEAREKFNREIVRCLDYLKTLAERLGLVYRDLDGIVSIIEQPGEPNEKGLGIPLHIDVVPVSGNWKYPPFSGTVAGDTIWGRGAQDDKGPLIACLYAIYALKKMGARFIRPIYIVMGRGEEVGNWSDVQYFIKKEGAPLFSFTPDAEFPVINGEKGIMNLKINASWDKANSEGNLRLVSLSGGERANVVPDAADVIFEIDEAPESSIEELRRELEKFASEKTDVRFSEPELYEDEQTGMKNLKVIFYGKSAHGSLPEQGHNAILDALSFLCGHRSVSPECRAYCDFLYRASSKFYGEGLNITGEHPFVGKTTVNLGICRINQKEGKSAINIRPTLGVTCEEIAKKAVALVKTESRKTGVEMFIEQAEEWGRDPLFVDPEENAFFISSLQEAYHIVTGREPELKAIGGTTFAKAYPNCVSFGPVDPAEEAELAHMTDEHIKIAHQVRNTKIYAAAIALLTTDLVGEE